MRGAKHVERFVAKDSDSTKEFDLVRHDGKRVSVAAVPAGRGGHQLRGYDLCALLFDESEFFGSAAEVASADVHVSDHDLFAAASPRIHGKALIISTPWPVETLTSEYVTENHGCPQTALVAIGPSLLMRPDDRRLAERVALDIQRDLETARREFFCEAIEGGGKFFDVAALELCIAKMPPTRTSSGTCVAAVDLGFVRDASALVILERRADRTHAAPTRWFTSIRFGRRKGVRSFPRFSFSVSPPRSSPTVARCCIPTRSTRRASASLCSRTV